MKPRSPYKEKHRAQFPTNPKLKDEIEEKNLISQKDLKQKIAIKRMRIKL
jgi:hypothetical protein